LRTSWRDPAQNFPLVQLQVSPQAVWKQELLACKVERGEPRLLDGITIAAAGLKITAGFTCFNLAKAIPIQPSTGFKGVQSGRSSANSLKTWQND
jgi:hypothetical protein